MLTEPQMQQIRYGAQEINKRANANNYNDYILAPELDVDLIGLMGEYAASLYFDIDFDFDAIYNVGRSDLINGFEVRSTTWLNGNLITYDKDKTACYILAVVDLKQSAVDLKGWLHIDECRQSKYWRDKPQVREASYWIPQSDLRPLDELLGKQ